MKQKRIIKLVLIVAIILIACCIKTTSCYAVDSVDWADNNVNTIISNLRTGSNNVGINSVDLKTSSYIFCRVRGDLLFSNARANYFLTKTPFNITIKGENEAVSTYQINNNPILIPNHGYEFGDELAYVLAQIQKYPKVSTEYGDVQKALWCLLGQYEYNNLTNTGKKIYDSAIAYGMYKDKIREGYIDDTNLSDGFSNIDYLNIVKSNPDLTRDDNGEMMGPFQITYPKAYYNGIGFGTVTLKLTDEKGNSLTPDKAWFYGLNKDNEMTEFKDSKYYKEGSITTAHIKIDSDFYVKVDTDKLEGKKIKIEISTQAVSAEAQVYFIEAGKYNFSDYHFCIECYEQVKDLKDSNKVVKYDNKGWILYKEEDDEDYLSEDEKHYKYNYYSEIYEYRNSNVSKAKWTTPTEAVEDKDSTYCRWTCECGNIMFFANLKAAENYASHHNCGSNNGGTYEIKYIYTRYYYKQAGCGENGCGNYYNNMTRDYQKLILQKSQQRTAEDKETIEASIEYKPINFTLGKYDSTEYGSTNKTPLDGAKFTIEATQIIGEDGEKESIFSKENVSITDTINIIPNSYGDIYVTITETKAPNGYIKLNEPIRAKYTYNRLIKTWAPSYVLDGWRWVNDANTDLPNTYESTSGDRIYVDEDNRTKYHQVYIEVYNDPIIMEKLTLLKVDADTGNRLSGAKFTGSISNIKSFACTPGGNRKITTNGTYSFSQLELTSGEISIYDVVLEDEDENVEIKINEIISPVGYKLLEGDITIILKHTTNGLNLVSSNYSGTDGVIGEGYNNIYIDVNSSAKTVSIRVPNEKEKIEIELEKYNSTGTTQLEGAKFTIEAKQDGEYLIRNQNISTGVATAITPISTNSIYVKITETTPPNGYIAIKESINIVYTFNGKTWNPSCKPDENEWSQSGFDTATYGGWDVINDGNISQLPNKYKSKSDDTIEVDIDVNTGKYIVKIYNEMLIEKLTLLKVDADTKEALKGVKFKGTISNVKSYAVAEDGDKKTTTEEELSFETETNINGEISFYDIIIANENNDIIVEITEIETLAGYKLLNEVITIALQYTEKGIQLNEENSSDGVVSGTENEGVCVSVDNNIIIRIPNEKAKIDIVLEKYNSTMGNLLDGAKFEINATQGEKTLINEEVTVNGVLSHTIIPEDIKDVTVTIKETEAPNGYKAIAEIIEIKYVYNRQKREWQPQIIANPSDTIVEKVYESWVNDLYGFNNVEVVQDALRGWQAEGAYTVEEWIRYKITDSSLENSLILDWNNSTQKSQIEKYGDNSKPWTLTQQGETLNEYTSKSGDTILVEGNTNIKLKIYNEAVIEKLTLLKVDADTKEALEGAQFRGTITNVKSVEGLTLIPDENNSITSNFTTNDNGTIVLTNLVLINENESVEIEIEEVGVPASNSNEYYYKQLSESITITITHEPTSGLIVELTYDGNEQVNITTEEDNSYAVKITIPNSKIYNIDLSLLKVDSDNNNEVLPGAIFSGTISNVEEVIDSENLTTNSEIKGLNFNNLETNTQGKIVLSNLKVIDLSKNIIITITEIKAPDGKDGYSYKNLEEPIEIELGYSNNILEIINISGISQDKIIVYEYTMGIIIPNERVINISGKVWLDGQTGIKDVEPANGIKDLSELGVPGIKVQLYQQNKKEPIKETYTDSKGEYEFAEVDYGEYYNIIFEYDGMHYEATTTKNGSQSKAKEDTKERTDFNYKFQTIEYDEEKQAVVATNINKTLVYVYENGESKLCTYCDNENNYTYLRYKNGVLNTLDVDYAMQASTQNLTGKYEMYTSTTEDVNFGLVARSTDLELTTDVYDAKVLINGEETTYQYNREDNSINVGNSSSNEGKSNEVTYLEIYESDYNYRIRDYITHSDFHRSDIMNPAIDENFDMDTGQELDVYVIYKVELQNQGATDGYINKIKYRYSSKYTYDEDLTMMYNNSKRNGITTFNIQNSQPENDSTICDISFYRTEEGETKQGIEVTSGQSKILYLAFKVNENADTELLETGKFPNAAEIMSYSTDEGYSDKDSQPGNYFFGDESRDNSNNQGDGSNNNNQGDGGNNNQDEDDDSIAEININVPIVDSSNDPRRKISGTVYNQDNNKSAVDDVIVQLIELKEYTGEKEELKGKIIEYIWQETVSGTGKGLKMKNNGNETEQYEYEKTKGYYEFQNFIPGDYIVRFIYGDGTSYDVTDNVITYNGQDYKSMVDAKYNAEWYNNSGYSEGASVARDNEARRLETMAYSVNVDVKKGILLKLLDYRTLEQLNDTEKNENVNEYNSRCTDESDYITVDNLTDEKLIDLFFNKTEKEILEKQWGLTEITTNTVENLLKEQALENTWMCAETSKIKVTVDNATATASNANIPENATGQASFTNINLGLTKRPETKIELKKYITGFKLTASNGQVLVNASIDVNAARESGNIDDYLTNLSNVNGIKNNLTLLNTVWQYEVSPTEINTVVEGAKLEYEYTLVVRNTSAYDSLSNILIDKYKTSPIGDYATYLNSCSSQMKARTKNIGTYLGEAYYKQNQYTSGNVITEVTNIRDYLNTNLSFISGKDTNGNNVTLVKDGENNDILTHRKLRDEYTMQDIKVNYLKTEATGKMTPGGDAVLYTITLGRDPITVTSEISFENYIAEVMSYTNAAGRRATTSTPANAEIIDAELREGRAHEEDEADTGRIQIGVKAGADKQTNYMLITAIAAGVMIIVAGAFVTKKYVIK